MSKTTIEWSNWQDVQDWINRAPEVFDEEVSRGLTLIGELLRTATIELMPVGTGESNWGHMSNAVGVNTPTVTAQGWEVEYGLPAGHTYGSVIEHGRTPGATQPPVEPIAEWVWSKRYIFTDVKNRKQAKSLAFAIARNIGKHGFASAPDGPGKGWSMFKQAQEAVDGRIDDVLRGVRDRIAMRLEGV